MVCFLLFVYCLFKITNDLKKPKLMQDSKSESLFTDLRFRLALILTGVLLSYIFFNYPG